ncbi:hypothetical protein Tco_1412167, partial [Tanacetum coccineum]
MSTPAYVDSELQSLGSRVHLMGEEFEAAEPSGTRTESSHSFTPSDFTTPLSPDHLLTHVSPTPTLTRASFHRRTALMTVRVQPAMSPGHSATVTEAIALSDSTFPKRYGSSYETPSPSHLRPFQYGRGTSDLILDTDSEGDELGDKDIEEDEEDESLDADDERERSDDEGHGSDDEGHGSNDEGHSLGDEDHRLDNEGRSLEGEGLGLEEDKEVAPKGQQQATPLSPEWSSGSLPISPSPLVVLSPIASPVATLTATISVDEDQFLEVGAQLELHGSILQDLTQRLDALPPTLIANIDRDVRELYT